MLEVCVDTFESAEAAVRGGIKAIDFYLGNLIFLIILLHPLS